MVDKSRPSRYIDEERDRRRDKEDRDTEGDREDRGRHNRLPTPCSDIELTRRVKPRYDFLDEDSGSFEELRRTSQVGKQPIRRVREVLDKKRVIETIKDMFSDHF